MTKRLTPKKSLVCLLCSASTLFTTTIMAATESEFDNFFGTNAGEAVTSSGTSASFFGGSAGRSNTSGYSNSFFGQSAGTYNTTGSFNSFFGHYSGLSNTDENSNSFMGAASNGATGIENATAIGYRAQVKKSDALVLGSIAGVNENGTSHKSVNVGIGTSLPAAALHVQRGISDADSARIIIEETKEVNTIRELLTLVNYGDPSFVLRDRTTQNATAFRLFGQEDSFSINHIGTGGPDFELTRNGELYVGPGGVNNMVLSDVGNLTIAGSLNQSSDRNSKRNITAVSGEDILNRLVQLPIATWEYKSDKEGLKHVGPMAQDFYKLFGLGDDETHLSPVDLAGVAVAALQAQQKTIASQKQQMNEMQQKHKKQIAALKQNNETLSSKIDSAETRIAEMEALYKSIASVVQSRLADLEKYKELQLGKK